MKALSIFQKCLRQQLRDPLGLALTLLTAPAFVGLYWIFFDADPNEAWRLRVLNHDTDNALVTTFEQLTTNDTPLFTIVAVPDRDTLTRDLRLGHADAGLIIPSDWSNAPHSQETASLILVGDASRPTWPALHAILTQTAQNHALTARKTASAPPATLSIETNTLGISANRTAFDAYVPGLVTFAVIMLIFSSAITVAREVEAGTLARLALTPMTAFDLVAGTSVLQFLIGLTSVSLTLTTAFALGFKSQGSTPLILLFTALACFSSVGIGMVVASISRSTTRAFLIASVFMFLLMLFSGVVFPRPSVHLFDIATYSVGLFDILPTTHLAVALNKIMVLGSPLSELIYELIWLLALSIACFAAGVVLFQRSSQHETP